MLTIIVFAIIIAVIVNLLLNKLHFPTLIGYIVTGTVITYMFGLHNAVHNKELKEIAEFGVAFLMFTIGLEFSFENLKQQKFDVFINGSLQILLTLMAVTFICVAFLGIDIKMALIIGATISLSSTAIVLKILKDNKDIDKVYGRKAFGILIMQDIAVIPILLLIAIFALENTGMKFVSFSTLTSGILLLIILLIIGKFLFTKFLSYVSLTKSEELFMGSVLFIAIFASYVSHYFGFSYSLGAFVAGMLISETKFKYQVEADLIPFRNILLGLFFVTVGMQLNIKIIFSHIGIILLLLIVLMALKFIIIYLVVLMRENKKTALKTAVTLIQIGEFSLAILELARTNNLITNEYVQILIATIIISMVITPFILKYISKISCALPNDKNIKQNYRNKYKNLENHIIILGYGYFGKKVVEELKKHNKNYVILEDELKNFENGRVLKEPIILGNLTKKAILNNINIRMAKAVIIAIDNPEKLFLICNIINDLTHNMRTIVKVSREKEKNILKKIHLEHIIVESNAIAKLLVIEALKTDNINTKLMEE